MNTHAITIGEAAGRTGVKVPTIRYYEQVGLLPTPRRTAGNHRHYSPEDIRRLLFIRQARDMGFPVASVRALLELRDRPDQSCSDAHRITHMRLLEVTRRIESLTRLREVLETMVGGCGRGIARHCGVLSAIGEGEPCRPTS